MSTESFLSIDQETFKKIQDAVRRAYKKINVYLKNNPGCQKIIIVGMTGAGKSTFQSCLTKGELQIHINQRTNDIELVGDDSIGAGFVSATDVPNFVTVDDKLLIDCPGFADNRGIEQEIFNALLINHVLSHNEHDNKVSVLIVIQDAGFENDRADSIQRVLQTLSTMFPDFDQIKDGLGLVITKAIKRRTCEQYIAKVREKVVDKLQDFVTFFENNLDRVFKFPIPSDEAQEGDVYTFQDRQRVFTFMDKHFSVRPKHCIPLTQEFLLKLNWIRQQNVNELDKQLNLLYAKLKGQYEQLETLDDIESWIGIVSSLQSKQVQSVTQLIEEMNCLPNFNEEDQLVAQCR